MNRIIFLITFILCFSAAACASQKDIVITDFEGANYGSWQVEGNAFGPRENKPNQTQLQTQMALANLWDEGIIGNMKIKAYLLGIFLRRK